MGNKIVKIKSKLKRLPIREIDREIFGMIRSEKKKIETRAGGPKYRDIKKGDTIVFDCGKERFTRKVGHVRKFKTLRAMLKVYSPSDIDPRILTAEELRKMYDGFPGYKERIKKFGFIAFELK